MLLPLLADHREYILLKILLPPTTTVDHRARDKNVVDKNIVEILLKNIFEHNLRLLLLADHR